MLRTHKTWQPIQKPKNPLKRLIIAILAEHNIVRSRLSSNIPPTIIPIITVLIAIPITVVGPAIVHSARSIVVTSVLHISKAMIAMVTTLISHAHTMPIRQIMISKRILRQLNSTLIPEI